MNQQTLDFEPHVEEADKPRLARQCRLILERLRRGPAMNTELAELPEDDPTKRILKYTSRISDLRKIGFDIPDAKFVRDGLWEYRLNEG